MKLYCDPTIIDHPTCVLYPFPHYLVITSTTHIVHGQTVTETRGFVICATCDHEVGAQKEKCECASSCHPNPV